MKDCGSVRTNDHSDDLACVRALLLESLAVLDRSKVPHAVTVATFVSHALEVLSPGADRFELAESDGVHPRI